MDVTPIYTEQDYRLALSKVSRLVDLDPELGTPDGDRLDILTTLVAAYEAKRFPVIA